MNTPPSCHIFCTVIDNFGDIGVSWRLARILQNECRWRVTLWLDDEAALRALCPGLPALPCRYRDTDLRLWREGGDMPQWDETADIVIETFGCNLPEGVKKSIARQKALWLNWEYLSAEEWAAAMHGKPSPQADGTEKFFWLMGFDERGGGLLREKTMPNSAAATRRFSDGSSVCRKKTRPNGCCSATAAACGPTGCVPGRRRARQ